MADACRWRVGTPTGRPGAIAAVDLTGEVGAALRTLGLPDVRVGSARLHRWDGVDELLVVRWREDWAQLMPHGSRAVLDALREKFREAGLQEATRNARARYPEAQSEFEARTLEALSRAASPRAVDLLLDQPRLWKKGGDGSDGARDARLRRLIEPPVVAAAGPTNVGKSSLLNALCGRSVAVVNDEPGTTRDHVGVLVELDGLVVRYLDTPGWRQNPEPTEREAMRLADAAIERADLLLLCADPDHGMPEHGHGSVLRVATKSDLGVPAWPYDAAVSARDGTGLDALAMEVRERLVPTADLESDTPWTFWTD